MNHYYRELDPMERDELTREQFHELLLAYVGSLNHLEWSRKEYGTGTSEWRLAVDAAAKALNDLEKAVFP